MVAGYVGAMGWPGEWAIGHGRGGSVIVESGFLWYVGARGPARVPERALARVHFWRESTFGIRVARRQT